MVLVMNLITDGTRDTGETTVILIEKVSNLKMENSVMTWLWIDGNHVYYNFTEYIMVSSYVLIWNQKIIKI
jgi:hypothetical protein